MLDVQTTLEEMTVLLDIFFQGLEQCGLVSAYTVSVETSTDMLKPTKRCLPLLLALIRPLEEGIRTLLEQHNNVQRDEIETDDDQVQNVETHEEPSVDPEVTLHVDLPLSREDDDTSCRLDDSPDQTVEVNRKARYLEETVEKIKIKIEPTQVQLREDDNLNADSEYPLARNTEEVEEITAVNLCCKLPPPLTIEEKPSYELLKVNDKTENTNLVKSINDSTFCDGPTHFLNKCEGIEEVQVSSQGANSCDEKIVKCEESEQEFESNTNLEHQRPKAHAAPKTCDMCGQVLSSLTALQDHCREMHEGAGCFPCHICKKRFMLRLSFKRHLETHEPSTPMAVCEICGKSFKRADYLHRHYRSHTGSRPHKCPVCKKSFLCAAHLKNHQEAVHSTQKRHCCEMCGRGFSRPDKLKEHVLRHLNVKRYSCGICSREYAERRDLKKHQMRCQAAP